MKKKVVAILIMTMLLMTGCKVGSTSQDADALVVSSTDLEKELEDYLNENIPENIMSVLISQDYKIATSEHPGEAYGVKYVDGLTDTHGNVIYVKNYEGKFRKSVAHEVGHAFDDCMDFPSKSEEFKDIYNEEKDSIRGSAEDNIEYCKQTPQEYFAEAFQIYIYEPEILKDSAPRTYKYINQVVK